MRFDRENYANARTLASFVYMGETFRVVRRRYDGKPWRKQLMVLHGNAPVSNQSYAWKDTTDPQECARLAAAYMARYLTTRKSLDEGLCKIHGAPSHGGRPNPDVTEGC